MCIEARATPEKRTGGAKKCTRNAKCSQSQTFYSCGRQAAGTRREPYVADTL